LFDSRPEPVRDPVRDALPILAHTPDSSLMLDSLDCNHGDRVSATELLQGLSSPGCGLEAWRQMQQIMNRADADGDGRVSPAELERMLVARQTGEPATQPPPATATDGTHGCIVEGRLLERAIEACTDVLVELKPIDSGGRASGEVQAQNRQEAEAGHMPQVALAPASEKPMTDTAQGVVVGGERPPPTTQESEHENAVRKHDRKGLEASHRNIEEVRQRRHRLRSLYCELLVLRGASQVQVEKTNAPSHAIEAEELARCERALADLQQREAESSSLANQLARGPEELAAAAKELQRVMDTRFELADEVTRLETVLREKEAARQKRISKANETLKEVERKREKVEKTISGLEAKREKLLIWLKDFEARSASEAETVTELRARRENLLAQLQDAEAIGAIEAEADARCEQALADLRRREGESKSLEEQVAMLRATLRDSLSSHLQIFGP
jgi:hypothetical protein